MDGVSLTAEDKEDFHSAFTNGVAASIGVKTEDVIMNSVATAVILNADGTGIDVSYTVIATQYTLSDLITTIESKETTDHEVTGLVNAGYTTASCSAEVITWVIVPPTADPTAYPTFLPSPDKPANSETAPPSFAPTYKTNSPTEKPSTRPTLAPSGEPSERPTEEPTKKPFSYEPTAKPSTKPTEEPTENPSHAPYTFKPTAVPSTARPTFQPTDSPSGILRTRAPTKMPITVKPTLPPTEQPTETPTRLVRTRRPTDAPVTAAPTVPVPTEQPTETPSRMIRTRRPTDEPTPSPPTELPTEKPTVQPTETPTRMTRTRRPTEEPTAGAVPTVQPTATRETRKPTVQPTSSTSLECIKGVVYVVGLQRIDTVSMDDAADPAFSSSIIKAVSESLNVEESNCDIQSIAAAKYTTYRGDAVDVIFSIYSGYDCPYDVDETLKGRTTTDNIVSELNAQGFPATASSEAILIDYSPTGVPTAAPSAAKVMVTVTQVVTGYTCDSLANGGFTSAFDDGISNGIDQPTCVVALDHIDEAIGNHGCDVTYTVTCVSGTNPSEIEALCLQQSTADACTAEIEARGYPNGVCGEVMVFIDQSPTQSPTEAHTIIFEAAQSIEGVCVDSAIYNTDEFHKAFEASIAECVHLDPSDVSIQGIQESDRDPPAMIVDYVVVASSSRTSTEIISKLNDECIPNGSLTELLGRAGYDDCEANNDAYIVDRSPTYTPTSAPSFKTYEVEAYQQIYGIDLVNATTPEFEGFFMPYITGVASRGGKTDVELIRIYDPRYTSVANRPGVAQSNDSNIVVEYRCTSFVLNDTAIVHNLNSAIRSGEVTATLQAAGYDTATSTTDVYIIVLNPTLMPSGAPTQAPTDLEDRFTDAEWAGITVGVVFAAAALTLYGYYAYVHQCLRTPIV